MLHKRPCHSSCINFNKNSFERAFWKLNQSVCGIDEVGRGCLAGPVVSAAVILPVGKINPLLKDSKIMSEKEREKAYAWIVKHCYYAVGITHNRFIDEHNIWQATLMSMKKAYMHVLAKTPTPPSAVLIDAMPLNFAGTCHQNTVFHYFPKGESLSSSIAAASIVAKVTRDRMMHQFDAIFPGYHLNDNKGYGTEQHQAALLIKPASVIHRNSFLGSIHTKKESHATQQSFC
ncbi:MAG TPA: ribonuclease HII [Candidatus Babeliales bacterium]|nr:ribonuclease HII [Candidatus Babeliales bacterium]